MTGLAAGLASGYSVFEACDVAGGICASYYMHPGETTRLLSVAHNDDVYRFEIGGGHWIFGGDSAISHFIQSLTPTKSYVRRSAIYFGKKGLRVPYPLQNYLSYFGKDIAIKALTEMSSTSRNNPKTLAEWLEQTFGKTLTELYFAPFHERYTAGLWTSIAPQDTYKSPMDLSQAIEGALDKAPPVGYNTAFVYPEEGLNILIQRMAALCKVHYKKKVVQIDGRRKKVFFDDGSDVHYESLISTLPLTHMMDLTGLKVDAKPDPYTSLFVLNIGGIKGPNCPDDHWLYIPDSLSGFHRVGFYSNVDKSFLPCSSRENDDRVSIYVERAYQGGEKPDKDDISAYRQMAVQELCDWGLIKQVEVIDPIWIDVAYTWSWPGSTWRQQALHVLLQHDIHQVGRFGRWKFQGIADSIRDGFVVGTAFRHRQKK